MADDASKGATGNETPEERTKRLKGLAAGLEAGNKTQGGGISKAGGGMLAAGAATGNVGLIAGGAALQVIGGISDKKKQAAQDKADAENKRRTKLMGALSQLGSGVGSVGMA